MQVTRKAAAGIVGVAALGTIAYAAGGSDGDADPGRDTPPPAVSTVEVLYEVEGSVKWADLTLETPTGTTQLTPDVPLRTKAGDTGLTYTFRNGDFVYLSAQMKDDFGSITCRISVDGVVISENTSTASFGIASCEGQT